MTRFPPLVRLLLLGSLLLTLGRAAALPFLAIYLTQRLGLDQQGIGLVLGVSLLLGTVSGPYAGHLADRFDRRWLIGGALATMVGAFLLLPAVTHAAIAVLLLAAGDTGGGLVDIIVKSCCAELLPAEQRGRAFSIRYMLTNIGYAVGPLAGAVVAGYDQRGPFWVASGLVALAGLLLASGWQLFPAHRTETGQVTPDLRATLSALRQDRRLLWFLVGATLSAVVYARFSAYLSQYLVTMATPAEAYRTMSGLIVTNAVVVILFQYLIGRHIRPDRLMHWIVAGSLLFALGLAGFMHAGSLPAWVVAMVVFTLGEIVVLPAEYLFIDTIAPPHLKGSYYGAQNLSNLGGAASPVLCGLLLTRATPVAMFMVLIGMALAGAGMYFMGYRQMRQDRTGKVAALPLP